MDEGRGSRSSSQRQPALMGLALHWTSAYLALRVSNLTCIVHPFVFRIVPTMYICSSPILSSNFPATCSETRCRKISVDPQVDPRPHQVLPEAQQTENFGEIFEELECEVPTRSSRCQFSWQDSAPTKHFSLPHPNSGGHIPRPNLGATVGIIHRWIFIESDFVLDDQAAGCRRNLHFPPKSVFSAYFPLKLPF